MWKAEVCAAIACISLVVLCFKLLRCVHAWELVDKTEMKPPIEDMRAGMDYSLLDTRWMVRRVLILVIRCPKCGTAKVIRETNP
jgi:hypothetical protein